MLILLAVSYFHSTFLCVCVCVCVFARGQISVHVHLFSVGHHGCEWLRKCAYVCIVVCCVFESVDGG